MNPRRVFGATLLFMTSSWIAMASDNSRLSAFGPGEQIRYKVSYLGLTAGSAQISVGSQMQYEGREVWPIVAFAQSESLAALYPIKDKFITYWHPDSQRSVGNELFADENRKKRRQRIQIAGTTATVTKQHHGEQEQVDTFEVHPEATDVAAVAFALRNRDFKPGSIVELPVFTGVRSFNLRAEYQGIESISTPMGNTEAIVVKVETQFSGKLAAKRAIRIFFSNDESKIPLKIEADLALGSVVAELTEFKPGRRLALAEPKRSGNDS